MRVLFLSFFIFAVLSSAHAQEAAKPPIEITADQTLEWHRDAQVYIARGNAIAKQGTSELHGEVLTAKYTKGENNKGTDITRIDASGNVVVISDGSNATGGQGFYDVKTGYSELTGGNLMLKTATDTVTARDKLTYDATKSEMNAYGDARAVRGDDVINGTRLIGRFEKDSTGNSQLRELEAVGNVVITSPTDIMYGDRGIYDAKANKAYMTGNVRIDRGQNTITGARGEIDLSTNISRMFGNTKSDSGETPGRVRGVFYPE